MKWHSCLHLFWEIGNGLRNQDSLLEIWPRRKMKQRGKRIPSKGRMRSHGGHWTGSFSQREDSGPNLRNFSFSRWWRHKVYLVSSQECYEFWNSRWILECINGLQMRIFIVVIRSLFHCRILGVYEKGKITNSWFRRLRTKRRYTQTMTTLGASFKCNCIIFVFLWMIYFT